jgi:hypothetical protein
LIIVIAACTPGVTPPSVPGPTVTSLPQEEEAPIKEETPEELPAETSTLPPELTSVPLTPTVIIQGESKTMTETTPAGQPELINAPQVQQAKEDLAKRLEMETAAIEVVRVEAVVWPDTSMGCPRPGMRYLQVPQDGLLIVLQAGDKQYEYHSGGVRPPFLCEKLG